MALRLTGLYMLRRQRAARATKNRSRRTKVRLCAVLSPPQFVNPAKPTVSLIRVAKPSYTTRTLDEMLNYM